MGALGRPAITRVLFVTGRLAEPALRRVVGGMQPELDSDVAVKALAENWAQRLDVRERFLEEARILRRADSDHIVRVYDIGEEDGTPYFVMTYADLGSLARFLKDPDPRVRTNAVRILGQLEPIDPKLRDAVLAAARDSDVRVRYELALRVGRLLQPHVPWGGP